MKLAFDLVSQLRGLFLCFILAMFSLACNSTSKDSSSSTSLTPSLDKLSQQIATYSTGTGMDTVLILNAWVDASVRDSEEASPTDAEETLSTLIGQCGYRDLVMQAVLQKLGFQTRRVNFYDVPVQIGHTATEVYIDGKWRFFDAEVGTYYAAPGALDVPLSLAEARSLYPSVQLMKLALPAWQRTWLDMSSIANAYQAGTLYSVYSSNTLDHPQSPGDVIFYFQETYITSKYADADHPNVTFPIAIDLATAPSGNIGAIDSSGSDLAGESHTGSGFSFYQPLLWALGYYKENNDQGIINASDAFTFSSTQQKTVTLKIDFIESMTADRQSQIVINTTSSGGTPSSTVTWGQNSMQVTFDVLPPSTTVEIKWNSGSEDRINLDALSWY